MTQSDNSSNDTAAVAASNPTSSFSLEQYYREKLANVRQQLPEVARQLKDAGAVRVQIQYDGCGDSGQIESIAYLDEEGKPLDLANKVSFTKSPTPRLRIASSNSRSSMPWRRRISLMFSITTGLRMAAPLL